MASVPIIIRTDTTAVPTRRQCEDAPAPMTVVEFLRDIESPQLIHFCSPDMLIQRLSEGSVWLQQMLDEMRVEYADHALYFAVFQAQFMEAIRHHLFRKPRTFLQRLASKQQQQSCASGACPIQPSKDSPYTAAAKLFTTHLFQLQSIKVVNTYLYGFEASKISLDVVVQFLRHVACEDLKNYIIAANNILKDLSPANVAYHRDQCITLALRHFGKSIDNQFLAGVDKIEECAAARDMLALIRSDFQARLQKAGITILPTDPSLPMTHTNDPDPASAPGDDDASDLASDSSSTATYHPQLMSDLEEAMAFLISEDPAKKDMPNAGVLLKVKRFLIGKMFHMSEQSRDISIIKNLIVNLVEKNKFSMYFPVDLLHSLAVPQVLEGVADGGQGKRRELTVGVVKHMIAGSAQSVMYSWSDMSVPIIYAIKLLRFILQLCALWVAVKLFRDTYIRTVYTQKQDPPSLKSMLGIFIGLDMTIQLVVIAVVVILLAPGGSASMYVNDTFMSQLLIDELVATAMIALLGTIVAGHIWRKTYFHYKLDGLGTIKSYSDIMVGVCAAMVVVPFFLLAS